MLNLRQKIFQILYPLFENNTTRITIIARIWCVISQFNYQLLSISNVLMVVGMCHITYSVNQIFLQEKKSILEIDEQILTKAEFPQLSKYFFRKQISFPEKLC